MEELERERTERRHQDVRRAEQQQAVESLRLARADFERQLASTTHERRVAMITEAIAEIDRRIAALSS